MKAKYYWHIHHGRLFEMATEPIGNRKTYIKHNKPTAERWLRLKLLKRAKLPKALERKMRADEMKWGDSHISNKTVAELKRLHKKQCHPRCPWRPNPKCYGNLSGNILNYRDPDNYHFTLKPLKKKRKARK